MNDDTRLLRVESAYFVAGALWAKRAGVARCVSAAPILRWMVGLDADRARDELVRRRCTWEWVAPYAEVPASEGSSPAPGAVPHRP